MPMFNALTESCFSISKNPFDQLLTEREIMISLFGDCNNRCKFCFQKDRYTEKFSEENLQKILKSFKEILSKIKTQGLKSLKIQIIGGELFQDKFSEKQYQSYHEFTKALLKEAEGLEVRLGITTNALWTNPKPFLDYYRAFHPSVVVSFDFKDRFNKKKIEDRFFENLKEILWVNPTVQLTTMRQNIEAIYQGKLDKLYPQYELEFNYFEDIGDPQYTVSETELSEFFKYLIDHYPNVSNIKSLWSRDKFCKHGIIIVPDKIQWDCCNRDNTIGEFFENKGCMLCEYFFGCSLTCFREFKEGSICHIREAKHYVQNRKC